MARASAFAVLVATLVFATACGGSSSSHSGDDDDDDAPPDADPLAGVTVVPLTSNDAFFYTAPVTIGSATFALDIDTGSTTLGVAGDQCTDCGVSPVYTTSHGVDTGHHVTATYLDTTSWTGEIYGDDVVVGSAKAENIRFAAINDQSGFFRGNGDQGIIGLGNPQGLLNGTSSYIVAARSHGDLKAPTFGVQLCKDAGTLWLGGVDESKSTTPLVATPTNGIPSSSYYWTVDETAVTLGGTAVSGAQFGDIVLDTGSSLSTVPSTVINALLAAVNGSSGYSSVFSQSLSANRCVSTTMSAAQIDAALPRLGITFTGAAEVTFSATSSYLFEDRPGEYCFAFENGDGDVDGSIFGDSMLNGMLVAFDDLTTSGDVRIGESNCASADNNALTGPALTGSAPTGPAITHPGDHAWWLDVPGIRVPHLDPVTHRLTHTVVR